MHARWPKKVDAVGWGVGVLGMGVVALGAQVARRYFGLPIERFGLVIGFVFVAWGVWDLLDIELGKAGISGDLLPIPVYLLGVVLVVSTLLRKPGRSMGRRPGDARATRPPLSASPEARPRRSVLRVAAGDPGAETTRSSRPHTVRC
jgi:hypothetical protein